MVELRELIPMLQAAIGPVILISGIGLLLLSMTNRFGRVTDRSRALAEALREATPEERERIIGQIQIFSQRGKLIRSSISLAVLSLLLAALLIIAIFLAALFEVEAGIILSIIFIGCMVTLIASLLLFLRDINLSLAALQVELNPRKE